MRHTLSLPVVQSNPSALAYFRFGEVAGRMLLTNDAGQWHFLSKDDLILAVLQYREEKFDALFEKWMQKHVKAGMNRLEAFFQAGGTRPGQFVEEIHAA